MVVMKQVMVAEQLAKLRIEKDVETVYTDISDEQVEGYYSKFDLATKFSTQMAREDATIFSRYMLGVTPYVYQDLFLNDYTNRIAVCCGRQVGKSTMTAIRALHKAIFFPDQRVIVFSKNIDQAKKLLSEIRNLIFKGDQHFGQFVKTKNVFSLKIDDTKPNNTQQITFKNGSYIKSLPATDGARGETADMLILDEAAFMEDDIFEKVIEPMVLHSGGQIILITTPNGMRGFFYEVFDPFEKKDKHDYSRYWFPSVICPNEFVQDMVLRKATDIHTDELSFRQEYLAEFKSDKSAYFPGRLIDPSIDPYGELLETDSDDVYCGVDWGKQMDQSVVIIVRKKDDEVRVIHCKSFPLKTNYKDIIDYVGGLRQRFKIRKIVADRGAGGAQIDDMLNKGWQVEGFSFTIQSKLEVYSNIKRLLERKELKIPKLLTPLINEMRAFQYELTVHGNMKLHHPPRGHDDYLDALVLACKPLNTNNKMRMYLI